MMLPRRTTALGLPCHATSGATSTERRLVAAATFVGAQRCQRCDKTHLVLFLIVAFDGDVTVIINVQIWTVFILNNQVVLE